MTKKDFKELAEQLAIVRRRGEPSWVPREQDLWIECVNAVMRACRATNDRFDTAKFRAACNS